MSLATRLTAFFLITLAVVLLGFALAVYLRANEHPPASLVNATVADTTEHKNVPSALLPPTWVTQKNMKSTVVADKFVPRKSICSGTFNGVNLASACSEEGI